MNQRFEALDAFRGLCAISVVLYHMHLVGSFTEFNFFRGSSVFVEFFFVLSGFVLTHGYGFKDNLNFFIVMKARFFRLYPLHLFMFLVFILLEFGKYLSYKLGGLIFNNLPFTKSFALSEMVPNLLLLQSWTPYTNHLSFNFPAWSISIEFYIYVLLFSSILIFRKYKVISWFVVSLIAFLLIYFKSDFLVSPVEKGLSSFFGGAFTYYIYKNISEIKINKILGTCIECLSLFLIVLSVQSIHLFEYRSLLCSLLFMSTVLFFSFESGYISSILKAKPLQLMGKLSYSIYMTHAAILFCLISIAIVLQKITGIELAPLIDGVRYLNFGNEVINNIVIFVIIYIIIITSSFTYKYVELYGQKLNKR